MHARQAGAACSSRPEGGRPQQDPKRTGPLHPARTPPERGEKPSAENVTGADTQPSPKGKCQRHKCQADHQNNTLCHLPLPVATSSRKSRTKISPPRKQIGCAASPPPTSRWGALDSTRGRLCCSYRACQIDQPRERRVHRRFCAPTGTICARRGGGVAAWRRGVAGSEPLKPYLA